MGDEVYSHIIKFSFLRELQETFQKEIGKLIEFYLQDAKKKINSLRKSLEEKNLTHFKAAARELRHRSIDVGAIHFSHCCLGLEIAVQEMRIESLSSLTSLVEKQFF